MIELVLVDFDDTIVDTAPRFQGARRALFRILRDAGFPEDECRRVHHEEVDPVMLDRYGLGPARLAYSFPETYRRLCEAAGSTEDDAVTAELVRLARAVSGTPPLVQGALEALRRLAQHHPTVVYTQSGEPDYQLGCVRDTGVLDLIGPDRVKVTDRKTPERLRETLDEYGVARPETAWMIGNSIRSDVNPALAIGANAVLVEIDDPWHHDEVEPLHQDFPRVPSFSAAVDLLFRGGADAWETGNEGAA